jgi:hypothetical protein
MVHGEALWNYIFAPLIQPDVEINMRSREISLTHNFTSIPGIPGRFRVCAETCAPKNGQEISQE